MGAENSCKCFCVRCDKVLHALQWLKSNNKFYADIEIDMDAIASLPVNGIPDELAQLEVHDDDDEQLQLTDEGPHMEEVTDDTDSHASNSFLPQVTQVQTEENAIRSTIAGDDTLEWPLIANTAINEFRTQGLATQVFPTLFPYGKADPTCTARHHAVTLTDAFKHLVRYSDNAPDGNTRWRFAMHP